jgi:NIPSNAP
MIRLYCQHQSLHSKVAASPRQQSDSRRMSMLRAFKFLMATVPVAAQGFAMENPDAQSPQICCPIVEVRQYTLHPGRRDVLIDLFDREFIESQEALGIKVIGQFRDLGNPNRFVWLRGFRDMPSRAQALKDFYGGPVWKAHREAANATMMDSDNVLLLHPATPTSGFSLGSKTRPPAGSNDIQRELIVATIYYFDAPVDEGFVQFFEKTVKPVVIGFGRTGPGVFRNRAQREHFSGAAGTGRRRCFRLVRAL